MSGDASAYVGINRGTGQDAAQVIGGEREPMDLLAHYKAQKAATQKKALDDINALKDYKLAGYISLQKGNEDAKVALQNYAAQKFNETGGKYEPMTDPKFIRDMADLENRNNTAQKINDWAAKWEVALSASGKDGNPKYTEESLEKYHNFLKITDSKESQDYVNKNGLPQPEPAKEPANYVEDIKKYKIGETDITTKSPTDKYEVTTQRKNLDETKLKNEAEQYVAVGMNHPESNKYAAQLFQDQLQEMTKARPDLLQQGVLGQQELRERARDASIKVFQNLQRQQYTEVKKDETTLLPENQKGTTYASGSATSKFATASVIPMDYSILPKTEGGTAAGLENPHITKSVNFNFLSKTEQDKKSINIPPVGLKRVTIENGKQRYDAVDDKEASNLQLFVPTSAKVDDKGNIFLEMVKTTTEKNPITNVTTTKEKKYIKKATADDIDNVSDWLDISIPELLKNYDKTKGKASKETSSGKGSSYSKSNTKDATSPEGDYTIKGKNYSRQAIDKAAKASGMSIDEYVKEVNK